MLRGRILIACLLSSLVLPCLAQNVAVSLVDEKGVKDRLESGAVPASKRQSTIRALFEKAGCTVEEQPVDKYSGNVICTLPGETEDEILVSGHFDFIDKGRGLVDDWSGTALLPSLYEGLRSQPRHHTYIFVAFTNEERGLIGSSFYVKKLTPEQRARISAVINLECLGMAPTKVWTHRATPFLLDRLIDTARVMNMDLKGSNVERIGDDDTHPFLNAKIPVISIHSVTQDNLAILHSTRDNEAAIDFANYYASYKLVAFYLGFLDAQTEKALKQR